MRIKRKHIFEIARPKPLLSIQLLDAQHFLLLRDFNECHKFDNRVLIGKRLMNNSKNMIVLE